MHLLHKADNLVDLSGVGLNQTRPPHLDLRLGLDEDHRSYRTLYMVRNSIFCFSWFVACLIVDKCCYLLLPSTAANQRYTCFESTSSTAFVSQDVLHFSSR
ncbi:unnamed protein product [Lactuca virosa]|uniref:Uncharacterized protein n=1 Tax=Lactuca virosa TaxID=75947 RepID=A0AAU9NYJ9_9ASTR|nr:unnamed protein product [Lactuca virosa]